MTDIITILFNKVKTVISDWSDNEIYAVSFFVNSNEDYSYRGFNNVSSFAVSYNTEEFCEGAGKYDEERWNYAFWSQDEIMIIDSDNPDDAIETLYDWYEENGITNIGYETENEEPVGHNELLNIASEVAARLQKEGYLKEKFGKQIPIIVHGLEYTKSDIKATKKANPNNEAKDFLKAVKKGNI
ncbi:MAG: hypothetical protein IJT79_00825 [Ruminococcus sp.]|nr:hypothetical protein [Ruminococcus sp.]